MQSYQPAEKDEGWEWAREALATQARVVGALILRETRSRFGRSQLGYLWAIAEPLGQVVVLSLIFGVLSRHPPFGTDMMLFFATGVLPFAIFNQLARGLLGAIDANQALLTIPIVQPIDTMLARALLETATSLVVMLIIFTGLTYIRVLPLPKDLGMLALAIIGLAMSGFGLGCLNAVLGNLYSSWRHIYDLFSRPLMLVSGVFFVVENMPRAVRDVVSYLPTLQGIEIFRAGYYTGYRSNVIDIEYFLVLGLVLCLIGLAAERLRRMHGE